MNTLDQFFTNSDIVDTCINTINFNDYDIIIEPSAGDGAFYNKIIGEKIGIDLDPKIEGLIQQDYLTFNRFIEFNIEEKILVIGNPPFGKNSSLALKFFNHSAIFADTIAFILPRTFRKASVINRLSEKFNLVLETMLPKNSFHLPDGKVYDVPCVWQVWKSGTIRPKIQTKTKHKDFEFVENRSQADFVVQRVGVRAGYTHRDFTKAKPSHYWIKGSDSVYQIMKEIDWDYDDSPKYDTAGNPSITKDDLITKYMVKKDEK
tara:strand:- start:798 stop:1583 length:786 start_codon:yes stop_codon:yes gene_type:complete